MVKEQRNVQYVASYRLCVGCGVCAYICPEKNISLHNIVNDGIRPRVNQELCKKCGACLRACPGVEISHSFDNNSLEFIDDLKMNWGPVLEVWEGYAADPDLRYFGSSGGLASALSLYCIEKTGMQGLMHIGPGKEKPCANKTMFSTTRGEILANTGSRYAPASPCDSLQMMAIAPAPCVFIGKPCDVVALRKAQLLKPELDNKVGIAIGIFCAGTPSTQGTLDLLQRISIVPEQIEQIRYRGKGWPGKFSIKLKGEAQPREALTYMEAWGFIQKYRPYRCYLCPDGTGEFADIACGDPWYRRIEEGEQGHSLALVRTERGREMLKGAISSGCVVLKPAHPSILEASQPGLSAKRGAIWGRLLAMKIFGIPTPRFEGFSLFGNWLRIPAEDKMRSFGGTVKRILQRGYYKPIP